VYEGSFISTSSPTHVVGAVFDDGYSNGYKVESGNWTKQNFLKRRNSNGQKKKKEKMLSLAIKEMQAK
jgi:hypothetical protein